MVNVENIPDELKDRPQWVNWKEEIRDGEPTKVPYNPHNGYKASCSDPSTWGTINHAVNGIEGNNTDGIGFQFSKNGPYAGVDLDDVVDESGDVHEEAKGIIEELDSYTEYSPSGTGFHIIVKIDGKETIHTRSQLNSCDGEIEIYEKSRYFTFTGNVYEDYNTVENRQKELITIEKRYLSNDKKDQKQKSTKKSGADLGIDTLHEKAINSKNGDKFERLFNGDISDFSSHSEADLSLLDMMGFWTGGDRQKMEEWFDRSDLGKRDKWRTRKDYRNSTIDKALENLDDVYQPKTKKASTIDTEELLAEEIYTKNGPKLAYLNDGELKIKNRIKLEDGTVYEPRTDEATKKGTIKLPTGVEEYDSTDSLLEEIRSTIHKYVDISEKYEKLASWYVMTTWVYDELSTLSYLRALGDTGTGKSRFLDVIGNLCYKPIFISGAVTPAPIYRLIEQWKGTLMIDEGDLRRSDAMNEVITILNCGFERNKPVIRCDTNDPDKIQYFDTFGPKVIATRQEFNDKALESRCLTEKMSQTNRTDVPDQLPKSFFDKAEELRNKLLKWRFDKKKSIDVEKSQSVKIGNVEPRLKQATRGFLAVFDDPQIKENLFEFLKDHQRELIEQRSQTWEGMIVNTIYDTYKENGEEPCKISPSEIAENVEESYGEKKITAGHVGKKLRSLKLETNRERVMIDGEKKQRRILVWDMNQLETLFERYVPEYLDFVTVVTDVTVGTGRTEFLEKDLSSYCDDNKSFSTSHRTNRHNCHNRHKLFRNQVRDRLIDGETKDIDVLIEEIEGYEDDQIIDGLVDLKADGFLLEPERGFYKLA